MRDYTDLTKLENSRNCLRRIARHDEPQFSKESIVSVMEKFVKTVNVMDETILVPCRLMDRQVGDSTDIIAAPGKNSTSNQHTLTSSALGKRGSVKSKHVHEFLNSSELFNLYNMLNALKNDLLWTGQDDGDDEDEIQQQEQQQQQQQNEQTVELETTTATGNGGGVGVAARNFVAQNSRAESIDSTKTESANNNVTTTPTIKGHVRRPSTASVASTASVSNVSDTESEISTENDSGVESESNKSDNTQLKKANNTDKATELAKRCKKHLNGLFQCLEQMTEAANYLTARYQSDIGPV